MDGGTNNNVGRNDIPAKLTLNGHFDIAPTTGIVDLKGTGVLGETFSLAAIKTAIAALAPVYADATAFVVADNLIGIEVDLDYVGGEGFHLGLVTNPVVATTSDAAFRNNGGWTDIDSGGGRQEGKEGATVDPTSFEYLWVANGSVLTVHYVAQKA